MSQVFLYGYFDNLARSGGGGVLGPLHYLTKVQFSIWWVILFLIESIVSTCVMLLIFYLLFLLVSFIVLSNVIFISDTFLYSIKMTVYVHTVCMKLEYFAQSSIHNIHTYASTKK